MSLALSIAQFLIINSLDVILLLRLLPVHRAISHFIHRLIPLALLLLQILLVLHEVVILDHGLFDNVLKIRIVHGVLLGLSLLLSPNLLINDCLLPVLVVCTLVSLVLPSVVVGVGIPGLPRFILLVLLLDGAILHRIILLEGCVLR